jgi:2-iminobutanoate/2-iminopropanoate deaminase
MTAKTAITAEKAPAAIGPYSVAVRVGDFLFCSGQLGIDPEIGDIVPGCAGCQTRQVLKNVSAVLEAAGATLRDVVKTTVFLTDMDNFGKMNDVYAEFFSEPHPARSTVAVKALPKDALVEIEVVAALG